MAEQFVVVWPTSRVSGRFGPLPFRTQHRIGIVKGHFGPTSMLYRSHPKTFAHISNANNMLGSYFTDVAEWDYRAPIARRQWIPMDDTCVFI